MPLNNYSERGSILITSFWALTLFSVLVAGLSVQTIQHQVLAKRERLGLDDKIDFMSALSLANQSLLADSEPHEDSFEDSWYGTIQKPEALERNIQVTIQDEESKINLNTVSEAFLKAFFELFENEVDPMKGESRDFIKQILKKRAKGRIVSMEELYLMEDVEREDIEKIRPYVTVYPDLALNNVNTMSFLVLEALIHSLTGDSFVEKELLQKLKEYREEIKTKNAFPFRSDDLSPNEFVRKLQVTPNISMLSLLNCFLPQVTCDSRTFQLNLTSVSGRKASAVVRERSDNPAMEVLNWHEE